MKSVFAFFDPVCPHLTQQCFLYILFSLSQMTSSCRLLLFTVALSLYSSQVSAETLCGGELVDTLQFVCGDRGFYFSKF